jgi:hypothetical protein|tara:strand:+ start:2088 stop:2669 length:582 start_codon:yes stop_codon:yes gene_type:complete
MAQNKTLTEEQTVSRFNRPVPGHSLTDTPKSKPYENPSMFSDPDDAVDFIVDKLNRPENSARFQKLMFAGMSVEEITNTIALGGFTGGVITPDIAEIIKPPIAMVLINMALEADIPVKIFAGDTSIDEASGMDDETTMRMMADRNPEQLKMMLQEIAAEQEHRKGNNAKVVEGQESQGGFMNMPQQEQVREDI